MENKNELLALFADVDDRLVSTACHLHGENNQSEYAQSLWTARESLAELSELVLGDVATDEERSYGRKSK